MKSLTYLLCAVFIFLITGFDTPTSNSEYDYQSEYDGFYFPAKTLRAILDNGNGIRMYNATFPSGIGETLMAVATVDGMDARNVSYFYFDGLSGGYSNIAEIDKDRAIKGCQSLGDGKRIAVTFSRDQINSLLIQNRATGIRFKYAMVGQNNKTLTASPAVIEERSIVVVSPGAEITIEHPCPNYCGENPTQSYLCNMQ